jgi:hypothetical protein
MRGMVPMNRTSVIEHRHRQAHLTCHSPGWAGRLAAAWRATWRRLIRELVLILTFALVYEEIRDNMVQAGGPASSHALLVVSAENALGLFHEQAVQAAIIGSDHITDAFNAYYGGTHFLVPGFILAWLLFRHPAHYGRARTALFAVTAVAFVCFWLFPVAPPRLLPGSYGIVDTLVTPDGSGHFETSLISAAGDQYASMPSLHVAWAVWCALAAYPVARHWAWRALAVAYPLVTTLVVVATGNHFFLDAAAGALLATLTWVLVNRASAWLTVQLALRRALVGPSLLPREHAARLLGLFDMVLRRLAGVPSAAALHRAQPVIRPADPARRPPGSPTAR